MSEGEVPAAAAQTSISESTDLIETPEVPSTNFFTKPIEKLPLATDGTTPDTSLHAVHNLDRKQLAMQAEAAGVTVPPGLTNPAQKTAEPLTWRQKIDGVVRNLRRRST